MVNLVTKVILVRKEFQVHLANLGHVVSLLILFLDLTKVRL